MLLLSGIDPRGTDDGPGDGGVALLELLGARWYRTAVRTTPTPLTDAARLVGEVAEQFQLACRSLNDLTDPSCSPAGPAGSASRPDWQAAPEGLRAHRPVRRRGRLVAVLLATRLLLVACGSRSSLGDGPHHYRFTVSA